MTLAEEGRRLALATALARHAREALPRDATAEALLELARALADGGAEVERRHRIRFDPPYPGATAGPERTTTGLRLVLACRVLDARGDALGSAFTTLIPGRRPQASVAPAPAPVPEGWRPLS